MELEKIKNNSMVIKYQNTENVLKDVCFIIDSAKSYAYHSVNIALVERNWLIGYRISEEELKGNNRADYGIEVIKKLSKELTKEYGKGFDRSNLYRFLSFYKNFPQIVDSLSRQSGMLLSWTHYRTLLQVFDKKARAWYEKEDYYIDLVFYNYILKCFVLIDLKTKKITHQDVGQMDMYVKMYDEIKKSKQDNPTIGILLCSETDEDIAKYSILKGNEQLFASKYKLYLPTEEELRAEIENQKTIFNLQHEKDNNEDNK
mgnify:CR=1 FL=1